MEKAIDAFIAYMHDVKKTSNNTEMSYKRDLNKVRKYLEEKQVHAVNEITKDDLNAYILYLKENQFAAATISRNIASIKAFFSFLMKEGMVQEDISVSLRLWRWKMWCVF